MRGAILTVEGRRLWASLIDEADSIVADHDVGPSARTEEDHLCVSFRVSFLFHRFAESLPYGVEH